MESRSGEKPKLDCFLIQHSGMPIAKHLYGITQARLLEAATSVGRGCGFTPSTSASASLGDRSILWWWAGESYSTVPPVLFHDDDAMSCGQSRRSTISTNCMYAVQSSREILSSQPARSLFPCVVRAASICIHKSPIGRIATSTSLSARRCVNHIERRAGRRQSQLG